MGQIWFIESQELQVWASKGHYGSNLVQREALDLGTGHRHDYGPNGSLRVMSGHYGSCLVTMGQIWFIESQGLQVLASRGHYGSNLVQ